MRNTRCCNNQSSHTWLTSILLYADGKVRIHTRDLYRIPNERRTEKVKSTDSCLMIDATLTDWRTLHNCTIHERKSFHFERYIPFGKEWDRERETGDADDVSEISIEEHSWIAWDFNILGFAVHDSEVYFEWDSFVMWRMWDLIDTKNAFIIFDIHITIMNEIHNFGKIRKI